MRPQRPVPYTEQGQVCEKAVSLEMALHINRASQAQDGGWVCKKTVGPNLRSKSLPYPGCALPVEVDDRHGELDCSFPEQPDADCVSFAKSDAGCVFTFDALVRIDKVSSRAAVSGL